MTTPTQNQPKGQAAPEAAKHNRFLFSKWGLAENPVHHHISAKYGDRQILGTVKEVYRNDDRGFTFLRVAYFNGEPWPYDPLAANVEVIR